MILFSTLLPIVCDSCMIEVFFMLVYHEELLLCSTEFSWV